MSSNEQKILVIIEPPISSNLEEAPSPKRPLNAKPGSNMIRQHDDTISVIDTEIVEPEPEPTKCGSFVRCCNSVVRCCNPVTRCCNSVARCCNSALRCCNPVARCYYQAVIWWMNTVIGAVKNFYRTQDKSHWKKVLTFVVLIVGASILIGLTIYFNSKILVYCSFLILFIIMFFVICVCMSLLACPEVDSNLGEGFPLSTFGDPNPALSDCINSPGPSRRTRHSQLEDKTFLMDHQV